jgi:polyferredoxin
MRDRNVLSRETPDGLVENIYRLQVTNMSDVARSYDLHASGIEGLRIHSSERELLVPAQSSAQLTLDIDADPGRVTQKRTPITLEVVARDDHSVHARSETQFFGP